MYYQLLSLKESFIQSLIQQKKPVSVHFQNDTQLSGIITACNSEFILLKHHFLQTLYTHRIRGIKPMQSIKTIQTL